jgi:hypothetical protein
MDEKPEQIARHIDSARTELGSNLHELEDKVRQAADWKTYFDRNPIMLLGLALGGGVLLATIAGSKGSETQTPSQEHANARRPLSGVRNTAVTDSLVTLKGALIGLAGAKVRGILNEVLPGFNEHYERAERETFASASSHLRVPEFETSSHRM